MLPVEQLPLWDVLKNMATDDQRAMVKRLVGDAAAILDRVIETFPTYTLHNSTHAENVVRLMAELLGDRVSDLTPLEAALAILSAYYHDIGMVFAEKERASLAQEPEWEEFLNIYPDAFIAVQEQGTVPMEIAEWYCRWRHADRVFVYLNRIPDPEIRWGVVCIREHLGQLCRSHNRDPSVIKDDVFEINYCASADLKFCAILLRLADILDFDHSRTPEAVYQHLGLARRDSPRNQASDVEWRKHLCAEGFKFPAKRDGRYPLDFVAGPDEPAVEWDLREFLDVIEGEFEKCAALVPSCHERWREFHIPSKIDRANIKPTSYRYGEYRFVLDQTQVLDLLMGENLYDDPHVFVRELLQNAIDTSRHRQFIERQRGNPNFEAKAIQVSEWYDRDRYRWVRFDDFGNGMDESIIRHHMLKVGSSYYRTAQFKAELLRAKRKGAPDFVPISRFGIGLLSCFIAGDRVEISTLHQHPDGKKSQPVRLSLNGLHGFYTLQTPNLNPKPMPRPVAEELGYRTELGTSIAVRLDPRKEKREFHLRELLDRYLLCPPVPVEFGGERVGGDLSSLVDQPWCERSVIDLSAADMEQIEEDLGCCFSTPMQIEFVPFDLTRYSATRELKGQMVKVVFKPTQEWIDLSRLLKGALSVNTRLHPTGLNPLTLEFVLRLNTKERRSTIERLQQANGDDEPLARQAIGLLEKAPEPRKSEDVGCTKALSLSLPSGMAKVAGLFEYRSLLLSHNGLRVPTSGGENSWDDLRLNQYLFGNAGHEGTGVCLLALSDSLRPDVSASRDRLRQLPWNLLSQLHLATIRASRVACREEGREPKPRATFEAWKGPERPTLGDLLTDELIVGGEWAREPIIETDHGLRSIPQVKELLRSGQSVRIHGPAFFGSAGNDAFFQYCSATLVQTLLCVEGVIEQQRVRCVALAGQPTPLLEGQKLFPPLAFVPYSNSTVLSEQFSSMNLRHPFAQWLVRTAPSISAKYPGILEAVRTQLFYNEELRWGYRLDAINQILARLRDLDPEVRPPATLILRPEDFGHGTN